MRTDFEAVDPADLAEAVLPRLQSSDLQLLPVVRDGALIGLINLENVGEFLQIQRALMEEA